MKGSHFTRAALLGLTLAAGVGLVASITLPVPALFVVPALAAPAQGDPITVEPVSFTRAAFTDSVKMQIRVKPEGRSTQTLNIDPTHMQTFMITVEPGAAFPWHTHPGPVLVHVDQGELVYVYADDCVERSYTAGTAFVDPGGDNVHLAFNPGPEVTVAIATFLNVPALGPLTIPVPPHEQDALNKACGY